MLSAEKLKYLRLIHNITQQQIADELGVSKNYISMVENRKHVYSAEQHDRIVNAIYKISKKMKQEEEKIIEVAEDVQNEIKNNKEKVEKIEKPDKKSGKTNKKATK